MMNDTADYYFSPPELPLARIDAKLPTSLDDTEW